VRKVSANHRHGSSRPIIVQGAQYGSEAKGAIAAYLCEDRGIDFAVRTGAVNAGHTVYFKGRPYKMQQLPTGWVSESTTLVIGAGALVHPEILAREVKMVAEATGEGVDGVKARLIIDHNAGVHDESHTARSTASGRHHSMGATGKGCSEALIDRVAGRGKGYRLFGQTYGQEYTCADTAHMLNLEYNCGAKILIEATQGTLLDLYTGPYPYVTHKPTSCGNWLAEAGLSPSLNPEIVLVVRTFPIRVAGNSGPMPMETSWPTVARMINEERTLYKMEPIIGEWAIKEFEAAVIAGTEHFEVPQGSNGLDQYEWVRPKFAVALSELNKWAMDHLPPATVAELGKLFEFTTVTRKLRRVANLSFPELKYSAILNRPTSIAVTFMNYVFPNYWYIVPSQDTSVPSVAHNQYINNIEAVCAAPVSLISYGPESKHIARVM
jgi:adenylosuccinate synthase